MYPKQSPRWKIQTAVKLELIGFLLQQGAGISKANIGQQEKLSLIDDDDNVLLNLMNLAQELPVAEGCILELEDDVSEGNNDTLRRRVMTLVATLRAALYLTFQKRTTLQYLQGRVNYQKSKWKHAFGHYMIMLSSVETVHVLMYLKAIHLPNTWKQVKCEEIWSTRIASTIYHVCGHLSRIVQKDGKKSLKMIIDTSIYSSRTCILNLAKQSHKLRDSLTSPKKIFQTYVFDRVNYYIHVHGYIL
ncbi:hypothetical protein EDC96DRAFT_568644 [Choanephora cucurbitarum]|nr:hypothetical protein EDC96DRAFT_568644 [Choanephora cucurbitarum]